MVGGLALQDWSVRLEHRGGEGPALNNCCVYTNSLRSHVGRGGWRRGENEN